MEIIVNHLDYEINQKKILDNIYIEFETGKVNGIIGKNGSGKTTLLKIMDVLLEPTDGTIKIGKYSIEKNFERKDINKLRKQIGFLFQNTSDQFFNQTVREELEFSLYAFKYRLSEKDSRVKDALKMVDLSEKYLDMNPNELSLCEKKKVALASILIYNPKIIILDEPTIGLDFEGKKTLIKIIRMLKIRLKKTFIIATHDTDFLHKVVDNVYVLYNGKLVLQGNKYDVFKQVRLLKKYDILAPKVIEFSDRVLNKKQVRIGYRDEINDLIKDIYRYVK